MRPRNLLLFLLLGTSLAILPAMASSETVPTIEATGGGFGYSAAPVAWSPSRVTVGAGGTVAFSNPSTEVPHGVIWKSSVKPTCSGVPVGEEQFGMHWSGNCTFSQAGTYEFECSVHRREMVGFVTVTATGTTTTMSVPAPTPTPTTTTPTPTPKPVAAPTHLTRAQKLAKALKACKKKPKGKRTVCRKRALRRYGPKRK